MTQEMDKRSFYLRLKDKFTVAKKRGWVNLKGLKKFWLGLILFPLLIVLFLYIFIYDNRWWFGFVTSICSSIIAAGILGYGLEIKRQIKIYDLLKILQKRLSTDFDALCQLLYWLYEELLNNSSVILDSSNGYLNNKAEFRSLLVKCQETHQEKKVSLQNLVTDLKTLPSLNINQAQRNFATYILKNYVAYYLFAIKAENINLKNILPHVDPDAYLEFEKVIKEKPLDSIRVIMNSSVYDYVNLIPLMADLLPSIGLYLDCREICVKPTLSLPERSIDYFYGVAMKQFYSITKDILCLTDTKIQSNNASLSWEPQIRSKADKFGASLF